jgi:hypothetical protein
MGNETYDIDDCLGVVSVLFVGIGMRTRKRSVGDGGAPTSSSPILVRFLDRLSASSG